MVKKNVFLIFVLFLFPLFSKGNQVSGYISIKWLSGYTYQATIIDYTIGNPNMDSVYIHWGDGPTSIWIHRSNGTGDTVCDSILKSIYTGVHTFPGDGTYRIWANLGYRVSNIVNMTSSASQDLFLFNTISISPFAGSVTSPSISNEPICSYGCLGHCYTFNLGAIPANSDSLSYFLKPFASSGYYVPANVSINPITGTLMWCNPDSMGLFSFPINMITYKTATAIDTQEVELQVNVQANCLTGLNELLDITNKFTIYPNPNNGSFAIKMQYIYDKKYVEIYNMLGENIYSSKLIATSTLIDIGNKTTGIYYYRVLNENGGSVVSGKFMIQK